MLRRLGWLCFGFLFAFLPTMSQATDIQINVNEQATVSQPRLALQPSGETFYVWLQGGDVFGRRFDEVGLPVDFGFQVSEGGNTNDFPDVAMNDNGQAVVVWRGFGNARDINGRLYDFDTGATSPELTINLVDAGQQRAPKVQMDSTGAFVVVYESDDVDGDASGIIMLRLDDNGMPLGGEQLVNLDTTGDQIEPALAMGSQGQTAVLWKDLGAGSNQLLLRLFAADGSAASGAIDITGSAFSYDVAIAPQGHILVVWESNELLGRLFDATGMPLTDAFTVEGNGLDAQSPTVAAFDSGDFQLAWVRNVQTSLDLYGRVVQADGTLVGDSARLTQRGMLHESQPHIVAQGDHFVMAYRSPDSSGSGIFSTCPTVLGCFEIFMDGFESGDTSFWSDSAP